MKKFLILIVGILLLSGFGCMRVDYVGQKFPILPEGEYVDFYRSLDEVPDNLKPIGRGTAMVPFTMIDDDIYLLFAEKAAEVGATAFAISDSQKVLLGATNEIESRPRRPDAAWSVDGTDGEGRAVYSNKAVGAPSHRHLPKGASDCPHRQAYTELHSQYGPILLLL